MSGAQGEPRGAEVRVEGLDFAYAGGAFRLRVPELVIASGERVAFVGPSGSGKSTLLALAAGILVPRTGRVVTGGVDWARVGEADRRLARVRTIGQVFQDFELLDHLDVRENVLLPYRVHPALGRLDVARERLVALTARTGIDRLLDAKPGRLSRGERQRVALCRALIAAPTIVLADEPTGSLDPASAAVALDLLQSEVARLGATLVMVTHDAREVADFDRVVDFADFHAAADVGAGGGR